MSNSVLRKLQQAHHRLENGDLSGAAFLCEEVLRRLPGNADALWLLGSIRIMTGQPADAVPLLERVVALTPHNGAALEALGLAKLMIGEPAAAEPVLRKAASMPNAPASVRMRLGIALLEQGRHAAAIEELERAIAHDPRDADAYVSLGRAHAAAGNLEAAAIQFERVLSANPRHEDALYNLGVVSLERGEYARARSAFERIVSQRPDHLDARSRLALIHAALGRHLEAIAHLQEIVRAQPTNVPALSALAQSHFERGALDEAATFASKACEVDPKHANAYGILSQVYYVRGEFDQAALVLESGERHTGSTDLLGTLVHLLHRMCDWPKWRIAWQKLAPELERSPDCGSPFYLLCEDTTPHLQLAYARRWAAARFGRTAPSVPLHQEPKEKRRLRIGYFSPDFHQHATAYLLAEVLERHDREHFEIFAYSYGPEDHSAMRARLRSAVEQFNDVAWDPDDVIVSRMRTDRLDVLVDLKGYTMGDRLTVMAQRPCAVQVAWVGYPGTSGAEFIDYLIGDPFVIPPEAESSYSEQILRLPHCYQPNDRQRPRIDPMTRAEYGLPTGAFIFCCFNQTVKITPDIWRCWMSLLAKVPNSVLWLLEDNRWASANLRASLKDADLAIDRLVIAPRLPLDQHLARYRVADVALDTFPYTSHTTASDALWMGCPLVALAGDTFASRVSGSILASCDLPDLIAHTFDQYEKHAYRFATDVSFMESVRERLRRAHDTAPLFDSEKFARDLERLYQRIAR